MVIAGMHLILFSLSDIHILMHFKVIQVPLNVMLQIPLSCAVRFWPKLYYRLGPAQAFPCSLILWYVSKIIYLS